MVSANGALVALGHFVGCFNGLGTVYSFGYWIPKLSTEFGRGPGATLLVMSMLQAGFFLGGVPTHSVLKRCGFRATYVFGAVLTISGLLLVSFAPTLPMTYCIFLTGVGCQCSWMVSGVLILRHLAGKDASRYSAFATVGSGFGTLAWAALAHILMESVGWRVGLRIVTAALGALYAFGAVCEVPPPPLPTGTPADHGLAAAKPASAYLQLAKNRVFVVMAVAVACVSFGYMLVSAVLGSHVRNQGLDASQSAALYMFFGIASTIGRFLAGIAVSYAQPLTIFTVAAWAMAATIAGIAVCHTFAQFSVSVVLLGLVSGPFIALLLPSLREIVVTALVAESVVVLYICQSIGNFVAPSLVGWMAASTGSYMTGLLLGAGACTLGAALMLLVTTGGKHASPRRSVAVMLLQLSIWLDRFRSAVQRLALWAAGVPLFRPKKMTFEDILAERNKAFKDKGESYNGPGPVLVEDSPNVAANRSFDSDSSNKASLRTVSLGRSAAGVVVGREASACEAVVAKVTTIVEKSASDCEVLMGKVTTEVARADVGRKRAATNHSEWSDLGVVSASTVAAVDEEAPICAVDPQDVAEADPIQKDVTCKEHTSQLMAARGCCKLAAPLEAGCLCGSVRFRLTEAPQRLVHCYCLMCRQQGGGPFISWSCCFNHTVEWADLSQMMLRWVRSSAVADRGFCVRCGSIACLRYFAQPDWLWIAAGIIKSDFPLRPDIHLFTDDKPSWYNRTLEDIIASAVATAEEPEEFDDEEDRNEEECAHEESRSEEDGGAREEDRVEEECALPGVPT